jgi:hypothetical protein
LPVGRVPAALRPDLTEVGFFSFATLVLQPRACLKATATSSHVSAY